MNLKDLIENSLKSTKEINASSVIDDEFLEALELASKLLIDTF